MINNIAVINSPAQYGTDVYVDSVGRLNVNGIGAIPASSVLDVQRIAATSEQICVRRLTFTGANSTTYTFSIAGYSMQSGAAVTNPISFISAASASATTVAQQAINAINNLANFNVSAIAADGSTTANSGVVVLIAKTATDACPNAPLFVISEADSNIAETAISTVTFAAPPSGGRTAQGYLVVTTDGYTAGSSTVASIVITDPGEGYVSAPTITISASPSGGTLATATAVLFEGEVVSTVITNAGTGYWVRSGQLVVGTPAAIWRKNSYVALTPNAPSAPDYAALSTLVSGATYTEFVVSYQVAPISGNTTFAQTTKTGQFSVYVRNGQTHSGYLTAFWGNLVNLRKGYRVQWVSSSTGTIAATAATGALTFATVVPTTLGIKPNDIFVVGTGAFPSASDSGAGVIMTITSGTAGFSLPIDSTNISAAAYVAAKRAPISR